MNPNQKNAIKNPRLASCLLLTLSLLGCNDQEPNAEPQPKELQGIWLKPGYGDTLVVTENGAEHYQFTQHTCLKADDLTNDELAQLFINPELSADHTLLTIKASEGFPFDTRYERQNSLPSTCSGDTLITDSAPTTVFEHLWHTFNDYYAFFEERSVDWNAQYAELRPLVSNNMTNEELLKVIDALLEPLDDGHVQLATDDDEYNFTEYRGMERVIVENFPLQSEYDDFEEYVNAIVTNYKAIRASYFDTGSMKSADGARSDQFLWGTIGTDVGYLRVANMEGLSGGDFDAESDLAAIKAIMASILTDLQNTRAMIVDVRVNDGGEDAVSLTIASFFTDQRRLAVSKFARPASGPTEQVNAYIEPASDTPYLNPVAVIGAPDTASAAEIFLMAMSSLPQTTLVGENSNGVLSDILTKTLPNGWEVGLSNEVYLDAYGVNHEVTGVPPTVIEPTFSLQAMTEGRDAAIDCALETLGYGELSRH